jgi:DNA-binding transcriptional LysR family regulator
MLSLDFISINYALLSARYGSFNKAAQLLGIKQSAVSRRVKALEERLGVDLFERRGNHIYQTSAGSSFLQEAEKIIDRLEVAAQYARQAGKGLHGEIKVGLEVSLNDNFIQDLILTFKANNPLVSLRFVDIFENDCQRLVYNNDIDIIFRSLPTQAPELKQKMFWRKKVLIFLSKHHALSRKKRISWEDLKSAQFLARKNTASEQMVVENFVHRGWRPHLEAFNLNRDDLFELVGIDQGVMVTGLTNTLRFKSSLIARPLLDENSTVDFYGIWSGKNINPAFERFLSLAFAKSMLVDVSPHVDTSSTY